jgi:RNA polymerase sigma factor (sigma-70 family)
MNKKEDQILVENLGLVFKHVKKFTAKHNSLSDVDDYFQAGCIGLLKAIRRHDPTRGELSTIAWICILQEIIKEQKKNKHYRMGFVNIADINIFFDKKTENLSEYLPKLSPEEYNILLYRMMNMSFRDIAECTNKSINTVKSVYNKAKKYIIKRNRVAGD